MNRPAFVSSGSSIEVETAQARISRSIACAAAAARSIFVWQAHGPAKIQIVIGRPAKVQSRPSSMKKVGREKAYLMKVCSAGSAQRDNSGADRPTLHDWCQPVQQAGGAHWQLAWQQDGCSAPAGSSACSTATCDKVQEHLCLQAAVHQLRSAYTVLKHWTQCGSNCTGSGAPVAVQQRHCLSTWQLSGTQNAA